MRSSQRRGRIYYYQLSCVTPLRLEEAARRPLVLFATLTASF